MASFNIIYKKMKLKQKDIELRKMISDAIKKAIAQYK